MDRAVIVLAVLVCAPLPVASADGTSPRPPLPSPAVPAAVGLAPLNPSASALPDRDPPKEEKGKKKARKKPAPPSIHLGEKHETDQPHGHGVGEIPKSKIVVKAEGSNLMAALSGAAFSHCVCAPSLSVSTIQLVQEFDIVPGDPEDPRVMLSMGAKIDGYLRSEKKGDAVLRRADAAIYPAGGEPCLGLALPPFHVSGTAWHRCEGETESPSRVVLAGRYILVITLVLETTADGHLRSHAEAVFAPGPRDGSWRSKDSPAPELEGEDFGFAVTLNAEPPSAD